MDLKRKKSGPKIRIFEPRIGPGNSRGRGRGGIDGGDPRRVARWTRGTRASHVGGWEPRGPAARARIDGKAIIDGNPFADITCICYLLNAKGFNAPAL